MKKIFIGFYIFVFGLTLTRCGTRIDQNLTDADIQRVNTILDDMAAPQQAVAMKSGKVTTPDSADPESKPTIAPTTAFGKSGVQDKAQRIVDAMSDCTTEYNKKGSGNDMSMSIRASGTSCHISMNIVRKDTFTGGDTHNLTIEGGYQNTNSNIDRISEGREYSVKQGQFVFTDQAGAAGSRTKTTKGSINGVVQHRSYGQVVFGYSSDVTFTQAGTSTSGNGSELILLQNGDLEVKLESKVTTESNSTTPGTIARMTYKMNGQDITKSDFDSAVLRLGFALDGIRAMAQQGMTVKN